jgi:Rrf2 family protein
MQVSSKTHYACLAVLELSLRYEQPRPVCLRTIAEAHQISSQFLVQILLQLKRAGIVESIRGASGGYRLAKAPDQISLLDVVSAMDGPPQPPRGDVANSMARALDRVWNDLSCVEQQRLAEITLDQLAASVHDETAVMYYI